MINMDCQFCHILRNSIGRFVVVGIVVNCSSDDESVNHHYEYGFIQRRSFNDNTFKLYYFPRQEPVKFVGCCDDIFEIYFPELPAPVPMAELNADADSTSFDLEAFVQQRKNLQPSVISKLQKEAKIDE